MNERTLRLDPDLADHLELIAQVKGMSQNAVIVEAVEDYVKRIESDGEWEKLSSEWMSKLNRIATEKYGS